MRINFLRLQFFERGFTLAVPENIEDRTYEIDFLNCVVDKSKDFVVVEADSHFSEFIGVHMSKIHQGKVFLQDFIKPADRQRVIECIIKKDSPYVYIDFDIINKDKEPVFIHCSAHNIAKTELCTLVFADVSKSRAKTEKLRAKTKEMNHLIDLITSGVCQFKVMHDMHFEAIYLNESCCRFFGLDSRDNYDDCVVRIDDYIHPEDKSAMFQALGKAMATGDEIDLECRILTGGREYIPCSIRGLLHEYDDEDNPIINAVFSPLNAANS